MMQKIKIIIRLLGIILGSVLIIGLLILLQGTFRSSKNGFKRTIIRQAAHLEQVTNNDGHLIQICGASKKRLYFAQPSPGKVYVTDKKLRRTGSFHIPVHNFPRVKTRFEIQVDSPNTYLFAGNVPAIFRVQMNTPGQCDSYQLPAIYGRSVLANDSTVLLRIVKKDKNKVDQVFARFNRLNRKLDYEQNISERHGDLGFSTDGLLHYDRTTGLAVYVEFYRNKIIFFNTALSTWLTGRTIDTVTVNVTDFNAMHSGHQKTFTNTSPKRIINSESCVDQGNLYVQSELQADNEADTTFSRNSVIDIYAMKDGRYKGSFYIPFDHGRRLWRFRVYGNLLVALYKDHVMTYHLTR